MRRLTLALLWLAAPILADESFGKLVEDRAAKAEIDAALKSLKAYFAAERDLLKGTPKAAEKRDKALKDFLDWVGRSREKLGVDVASKPGIFLELFDRGRVETLPTPPKGQLTYVDADRAAGRDFGYTFLTPKSYDQKNDARYPLVLTLHGRVIDMKHPAFGGNAKRFVERSRAVVHDYWLSSPAREEALIFAPTGQPIGFEFTKEDRWHEEVTTLFLSLWESLNNFRVDWDRIFLEVQGPAMRVCCEYPLIFAGLIVRDGEVPPTEFVTFENLNGTPLCYVADQKKWERSGKAIADALTKAYADAGAPGNLLILQGQMNANGALQTDEAKIAEFLRTHRRVTARSKLRWRFFRDSLKNAGPCELLRANVILREGLDLAKHAGTLTFEVKPDPFKDAEGKEVMGSRVEIQVTEAESLLFRIDESQVPLDGPVTFVINGEVKGGERQTIRRDLGYFVREALPRRFFMFPYVADFSTDFALKPQVEPEAPPAPPAGEPPGEGCAPGDATEKPAEPEKK